MSNLLSVIIPAYNEITSIEITLRTVAVSPPLKEIIVVNDGSSDGTKEAIEKMREEFAQEKPSNLKDLKAIHKEKNAGKGAAIRSALKEVVGEIVLIQDADLELDPYEYPRLLDPFEKLGADVVFGSRFRREGVMRVHETKHFLGNKFLTWVSNFCTGLYLTDMETCYKVFKRELISSFNLRSNRFGIEPELTAKAAKAVKKKRLNFFEVPISYRPRTYAEGKKIGVKDGLVALWAIIYFNFFDHP